MIWAALLLSCASIDQGEKTSNGVSARLLVNVLREGAGPGRARVRLEIDVTGPPSLEAEFPRLGDALAAWAVVQAASSWRADKEAHVSLALELKQIRDGQPGLPDVILRVRPSPDAEGGELIWPEPLHDLKDVAEIEPTPPPPERTSWPWLLIAFAFAALLLVPLLWRGPPRITPISPRRRALDALDALPGPAEARFDAVEAVLRRYLAEEHAVPPARTAAELEKEWPAFAGVFRLCERARFSGLPVPPAELEEALSLARQALAEAGEKGEPGKPASAG
jgi:hypothetical protein